MNTTTPAQNSLLIDYLKKHEGMEGAHLTCTLACEGGGKNYSTHRKRFLNLLKDLEKDKAVLEAYPESLQTVVELCRSLATDGERWSGDYEGVCIHVSEQGENLINLRRPPIEFTRVEDRFYYRPAAGALAARREMLALSLSFKQPELYIFDGESAEVFGEIDLPESVYAFSEEGALDASQHAHIRRSRDTGTPQTVNQGFSPTQSPRELNEPIFLRELSHALRDLKESQELPLLVVGDENIVGEFVKVYDHPFGEIDTEMGMQSHPKASDIARICSDLCAEKQRQEMLEIKKELKQAEAGRMESFSDNVKEIYEAAEQGRVASCAVASDENAWCRFDEKKGFQSADPEKDSDAVEALDWIFVKTWLNGGKAIAIPSKDIPGVKKVAALYRW
ncbi:hypothetical protein [Pelagicoccus sp. SDUM812003]|uniref:baeRF3 domain-containing protein n=1 Tax=Pelagicoccus sp. SDUM812003 TaxID=3041267 RepID=UPI00280F1CE6|nr:hypothetical protein [Pelagicoccus sp. SDUM812003]MDQ8204358.1 hypothetical protein [Pelagicoccus sp. SDUM812003]